eukprot:XP_012810865.1 PREDICTED: UDP-glucuronosyltransferase 2B17 isoform X1 [Xenopus tropicalis]
MLWFHVSLLLQATFLCTVSSEKILAWPADASHWLNLKLILEEVASRGHEVTALIHSANMQMGNFKSSPVKMEIFPVPFTKERNFNILNEFIQLWVYDTPYISYWEFYVRTKELLKDAVELQMYTCDGVVKNKDLLYKLQNEKFDVVVADPLVPCGELIAEILGVPFVYTFRFSMGNSVERLCGQLPSPFSYVPGTMAELIDRMSFGERLVNTIHYLFQDLLFALLFQWHWDEYYSEVLDASHWLNLRLILEELAHKGHEVTALVHSANMLIDHNLPSAIKAEVFPVAFTKETFLTLQRDFFNFWIYGIHNMSYWELYEHLKVAVASSLKLQRDTCDGVLKNKELMYKLQNQKFDIVVADPVAPCGELIAESLGVPFVYSFRFSMGNSLERLCGQLPSPFSYVPGAMTALSDKMSFGQRLANTVLYAFQDLIFSLVFQKNWDNYYSEILGRPAKVCEIMGKAEIWLIRTYWDFEYPRPILPNFKFVGGLHCAPAKPLPEVLWRYSGKKPDALGENTITYDWIPQNDLLGHPKTKAFITHGGTNGIYEAIYHRVPIVGIPLFAEQPDNIVHMKSKGMAIMLDFNKMGTQDLLDAVNTVINNPTYKENAMRLSRIHHDQPVKPLDSAVFWIEFVMRHKGAKHLRPASHELTWYQYHCLDVIGFMFVCLLLFFYITITFLTFCYKKCCRTTKEKNQ